MNPFKNSPFNSFLSFFFTSYKISSIDKNSLQENQLVSFRAYQAFVYFIYLLLVLVVLVFFFIGYGPGKKILPQNIATKKGDVVELMMRVDSLERGLILKSKYIAAINNIIAGQVIDSFVQINNDSSITFQNLEITPSKEDTMLRRVVENEDFYNIPSSYKRLYQNLDDFVFFKPASGLIIDTFNLKINHFGVDIATNQNEAVKSILDGVVIFSDWSILGGHTIIIQHIENIISVYMHNSSITKVPNDIVRGGEVVAIVGNSGKLSTGPHLHFELWQNGSPMNPLDYIDF